MTSGFEDYLNLNGQYMSEVEEYDDSASADHFNAMLDTEAVNAVRKYKNYGQYYFQTFDPCSTKPRYFKNKKITTVSNLKKNLPEDLEDPMLIKVSDDMQNNDKAVAKIQNSIIDAVTKTFSTVKNEIDAQQKLNMLYLILDRLDYQIHILRTCVKDITYVASDVVKKCPEVLPYIANSKDKKLGDMHYDFLEHGFRSDKVKDFLLDVKKNLFSEKFNGSYDYLNGLKVVFITAKGDRNSDLHYYEAGESQYRVKSKHVMVEFKTDTKHFAIGIPVPENTDFSAKYAGSLTHGKYYIIDYKEHIAYDRNYYNMNRVNYETIFSSYSIKDTAKAVMKYLTDTGDFKNMYEPTEEAKSTADIIEELSKHYSDREAA